MFILLLTLPALACGGVRALSSTETPTLTATASATPSPHAPTTTPQLQPTLSPTPNSEATPTLAGAAVSYSGISFVVDPALGYTAYAHDEQMYGAEVNYTRFTFAPEGWCREVGCVEVYPVAQYQAAFSEEYPFPPLGAATVLRAQDQPLNFQNGTGTRSIRIRGQAAFFANNEDVVYDFAGFTDDGQYYVSIIIPIDAPILLSVADPEENNNPAALLPRPDEDEVEYNREIERQLDLLAPADFTPDLSVLDALVASLRIEAPPAVGQPTSAPPAATPTPLPPTAIPIEVDWQNHTEQDFELEHPGDWEVVGPDGIECAALYHFFPSSLKLIAFSACWEDNVGGNPLTFAETYERFRQGFIEDALISFRTINGVQVEIIQYGSSKSNGVYVLTASHGTVALWQREDTGWALVDEENQYQQNQIFDRILESFKFHTEG